MLERKIYNQLLNWKNKEKKMCLVVKGARQVGKTFIIDRFAEENYDNYIKINFIEKESYKKIFDGDLDAITIYKQLSLNINDANLVPGKTLIFLDEIQACPRARTGLKFWVLHKVCGIR